MQRALNHLRASDPVLAVIIERVGPYRPRFIDPGFGMLVKAIVNQQLSGKAAATILARLEVKLLSKGGMTPEAMLALRSSQMKAAGLSAQKQTYLKDLARKTAAGELDFELLRAMDDRQVIERLTQIKGIGVWTAHMFLIFGLRRPDVLPSGDLGIQAAVHRAYGLDARPKPAELEQLGLRWRPWSSVAAWYLWRSLEETDGW
ncbi:MAG: DNA-3-methyladenine glycosylase 2 family protein [Bryobacterales bacterium]|nr:DNA-3-methyladenine glycosylase 2 family protein [Bryobacterales bacterium]